MTQISDISLFLMAMLALTMQAQTTADAKGREAVMQKTGKTLA